MKRTLPETRTDRQARATIKHANLTQYDLSRMRPMRFYFAANDAHITLRLPRRLLDAIKAAAQDAGVPYQRLIRHALEEAIAPRK